MFITCFLWILEQRKTVVKKINQGVRKEKLKEENMQ